MKDYDLTQLIALLDEHTKQGLGIWVRQKDDFTICLVGVADANAGQFIAAYFPCARNSKRYQIGFDTLRELEKESADGTEAPTIRLARINDYRPQPGAGRTASDG